MRKYFLVILTFLFASSTHAENLATDCSSKVCFPIQKTVGDKGLKLISSKLFKYYIWTAYSIALHADPKDLETNSVLSDIHKSLVLHYHRDFTAADIVEAADKLLKSNPEINFESIAQQVAQINALYVDIKEGDFYTLEYVPDQGTSLLLNNKLLGTVKGAEFAKAYFGIWLSKYSLSESLTRDLIGHLKNEKLA